jgi:hypothetical protein
MATAKVTPARTKLQDPPPGQIAAGRASIYHFIDFMGNLTGAVAAGERPRRLARRIELPPAMCWP